MEREEVLLEGAPLLDNINDDLLLCRTQLTDSDEYFYYAMFPDEGASTVTQAKFTYEFDPEFTLILLCSISGQDADRYWNFDELC